MLACSAGSWGNHIPSGSAGLSIGPVIDPTVSTLHSQTACWALRAAWQHDAETARSAAGLLEPDHQFSIRRNFIQAEGSIARLRSSPRTGWLCAPIRGTAQTLSHAPAGSGIPTVSMQVSGLCRPQLSWAMTANRYPYLLLRQCSQFQPHSAPFRIFGTIAVIA